MTLTKSQIVESIYNQLGCPKNEAVDIVEALLEIIKADLAAGNDVMVSGFGRFCVREKSERRGRNPATEGEMMLRARRVVTFRCSGKLREKVNGE